MPLRFLPTEPGEQSELASFLASAFQADPGAGFVDPQLLRWKYFEPRADWRGPRSYVLKDGSRVVAHACVHPVTFLTAERAVTSMRFIDWAAGPGAPGAGILLLRNLERMVDALLAVGGSEGTRQILPKAGFRMQGRVEVFARVVRPLRQWHRRPSHDWKSPLRYLRNAAWSLSPLEPTPGWHTAPLKDLPPGIPLASEPGARPFTATRRTPELLEYLLRCPAAHVSLHTLERGERLLGYFVLSRVGPQVRIADLHLDSAQPADWRAAFSVAAGAAALHPEVCETVATAGMPVASDALAANGFRLRRREPVFLRDPANLLACAPPLNLTLLDGDEFYLLDPAYPFLT